MTTVLFMGDEASPDLFFIRKTCLEDAINLELSVCTTAASAAEMASKLGDSLVAVVTKLGRLGDRSDSGLSLATTLRPANKTVFIMLLSVTACTQPASRVAAFDAGVNMVSHVGDVDAIRTALTHVAETAHTRTPGGYTCPYCGMRGLTELALWHHMPLHHINTRAPPGRVKCPVCDQGVKEFQVHMHNAHRPASAGPPEDRSPASLFAFALVVIRRPSDGRFLLVQEFANSGFWLPGGRVDKGEDFMQAAIRESREEAGIEIKLTGVLSVQSRAYEDGAMRTRVIFVGEPAPGFSTKFKTLPDFESVGAAWFSIEDILEPHPSVKWRGPEPQTWCGSVAHGGHVSPMTLFGVEGAAPPPAAGGSGAGRAPE